MLRRARQAAELTQEELAERARLSGRAISDLERGIKRPRRDTLDLLAEALGLSEKDREVFNAAARQPIRRGGDRQAADEGMEDTTSAWVYVAHAQADDSVVDRLRIDLQHYRITVWVDEHDLLPGTPDWEQALREAIRASLAILLLASPHTRSSRYVADELRVAELYGRRVYPLWIDGEQWMECVPLGWGGLQYLDARGERYTTALTALATEIQRLLDRQRRDQPNQPRRRPCPRSSRATPIRACAPFTGEDAGDFFGREQLVEAAASQLLTTTAGAAASLPGAGGRERLREVQRDCWRDCCRACRRARSPAARRGSIWRRWCRAPGRWMPWLRP